MSVIVSSVYALNTAGDASKKLNSRESFEEKYEATFGEKPSDKIWTLGMQPQCHAACTGGTKCSTGKCRGNA